MKKRIVILAAFFILGLSASYAKDGRIPDPVASEFGTHFSNARNVKWEQIGSYYRVTFDELGTTLFAFYTEDADLMGIANYELSDKLPASLRSEIKNKYGDYWITDLFRYSVKDTRGYFIELENADRKIMLKSDGNQKWYIYNSFRKQ